MFKNIYPLFEPKRLLKKEMLENLRDFPRNMFGILYQDYSDGILSGCELETEDESLLIKPGIICHKGIPYLLEEPWKVPYEATGKLAYLKVRFPDKSVGTGQDEYLSQICLEEDETDEGCELELARFKLQEGARLRDTYADFFDYNTEFDTINRIYAPYASPERSSIYPQIMRTYARTLMEYPIQNPWDYAFCMECLRIQSAIPYREIHAYLNTRLEQKKSVYSNKEIYKALGRILREAGGSGTTEAQKETGKHRLLLL